MQQTFAHPFRQHVQVYSQMLQKNKLLKFIINVLIRIIFTIFFLIFKSNCIIPTIKPNIIIIADIIYIHSLNINLQKYNIKYKVTIINV